MSEFYILDKEKNPVSVTLGEYEEWEKDNETKELKVTMVETFEVTTGINLTGRVVTDFLSSPTTMNGFTGIFRISFMPEPKKGSDDIDLPDFDYLGLANSWSDALRIHDEVVNMCKTEGLKLEGYLGQIKIS